MNPDRDEPADLVPAGELEPWQVGELPEPPRGGWRLWASLLGPGVLLAGASIGTGEWLFGPAVSAQYGGTLLWLATLSILGQLFANLVMMRYTLYCGEPILVGAFRTWPGPIVWTAAYAILEVIGSIFPYNAANAAVPLAAATLGHLPGNGMTSFLGFSLAETQLVKLLGYLIFLVAFVPLVFGGTIYRMLERLMAAKIVIILSYLTFVAVFMVSGRTAREVISGFGRFGSVPIRADSVVVGRHFTLTEQDDTASYTVKGTFEAGQPVVTAFLVNQSGTVRKFKMDDSGWSEELIAIRNRMVNRAQQILEQSDFYVEYTEYDDPSTKLIAEGKLGPDRSWQPNRLTVKRNGQIDSAYESLASVPEPVQSQFRAILDNQGLQRVNLVSYVRTQGHLPDLDWAMLAGFAAIAGAGGLTNTLFSNYARDKGWGMGARVGAIPSAVGGHSIALSHIGQVFRINSESLARWYGWLRHILRDQVAIWMFCCFVGMGLPCMLSIEFIRNAPVEGNRVAAMTADGIAERYPGHSHLLWTSTLLCGFLIIAPGQIVAGDTVARRWSDIIWTCSTRAKQLGGHQVKHVYYGILAAYAVFGFSTLAFFDPLQIAKVGTVMQNLGMGFSSLHALYVNRKLMPAPLRPNWFMQAGVICCGIYFFGISLVVLFTL